MNAILLLGACAIAFMRPVWGFGIILLLTATLFHLDQYFRVALPVGFIEAPDALIVSMLASVLIRRAVPSDAASDNDIEQQPVGFSSGWALITLAPYVLWQTVSIVFAIIHPAGGEATFRLAPRYLLAGVLPWLGLYILAKLRAHDAHQIFNITFYLTVATALVHVVLQVTDYRPLMGPAYFWVPQNSENDFSWVRQWLTGEKFLRGLPQGVPLILFFAILAIGRYLLGGLKNWLALVCSLLLFAALFVTVTRSLMVVMAVGIAALFALLAACAPVVKPLLTRCAGVIALFALTAFLYDAVRPGFLEYWGDRMSTLSGADSKIFSAENSARGLDNLSSLAVISDYPLFGIGMARYPTSYSYRNEPATDIHPMLEVGLVGGIPAVILVIVLQVRLFASCLGTVVRGNTGALEVAPIVAALITSAFALNLAGGGGSIYGTPILALCIITYEMFYRRSLASTAIQSLTAPSNDNDYERPTAHDLYPDPVI